MASSLFAPSFCKDQIWIVTGGGTGIGFCIAKDAVCLGAKVVLTGRREQLLRQAVEKLGSNASWIVCDIRKEDAVEAMVKSVMSQFGRVDVLVNNAGGQYMTTAENCKPKGFEAVVRNNLLGTWMVTYHVVNAAMIPQKSGAVINIIAQIRNGFPGMVHTGAARAGVDNLTKTCAIEWAHHNIRVNSVAPGVIWSSGTQTHYPEEALQSAATNQPIQRLGTAEEVSNVVLFLASNRMSGFTTGQTWYVDGGQSLSSRVTGMSLSFVF